VKFKDVIGHKELKRDLIREIQADKISHAQLFLGKAGFGGLPLALAFVQYLFCENKQTNDSCGVCPSCVKNSDLQHPDVHFCFPIVLAENKVCDPLLGDWRSQIKKEPYFNLYDWTNVIDNKGRNAVIGTEQSGELLRKLSLKSYEGGYKVMFVWMAEQMNATFANKILKILEEPPARTLFILLTESPDKLLITIRSRTQLVRIPRISSDDLTSYLITSHQIDPQKALTIANFSEGNYLEVLETLEFAEEKGTYTEWFIQMMRSSYKKDVHGMMNWADGLSKENRERQKQFISYALHMFRLSIMTNYLGIEFVNASEEEVKFLKNFAPFISGNNIREFFKTFNDGYYHIERNAQSKILFTQLCFQTMRYIHVA
jgi:DNA polymerase III subunit delta'